jgi:hypothetical protein
MLMHESLTTSSLLTLLKQESSLEVSTYGEHQDTIKGTSWHPFDTIKSWYEKTNEIGPLHTLDRNQSWYKRSLCVHLVGQETPADQQHHHHTSNTSITPATPPHNPLCSWVEQQERIHHHQHNHKNQTSKTKTKWLLSLIRIYVKWCGQDNHPVGNPKRKVWRAQ